MRRLLLLLALSAPPAAFAVPAEAPPALDTPDAARPTVDESTPRDQRRAQKDFDRALAALDAGRDVEAAEGFEALLASLDWPEASYNAGLARYRLAQLVPAERHARAAVEGLEGARDAARLHAVVLHSLGRYRDALERVAQVRATLEPEEHALRARLALLEGTGRRELGAFADAGLAFADAREAAAEAGDPGLQAAAWLGTAQLARASGDDGRAAEALAKVSALGGSGADRSRAEASLSAAEEAWRTGDEAGARSALAQAVPSLLTGEDPLGEASLAVRVATLEWSLGQRPAARKRLEAARATLSSAGAAASLADAELVAAGWAVSDGDIEAASAHLQTATTLLESAQAPLALASAWLARAPLLAEEGDVRAGIALAEKARSAFEAMGHPHGVQGAWMVLAELQGRGGALAEARESALEAVRRAQELGNPRLAASARAEVAVILARLGAVDEALTESERALATPASGAVLLSPRTRVRMEVELAQALARARHTDRAVQLAQAALAHAAEGAAADLVPAAEEAVVAVLLEAGRSDEAEAFLDQRGLDDPRLRDAVADRRGTELYNEGIEAYDAGEYGRAAARFRELIGSEQSPQTRKDEARRALQTVLEAQVAEAVDAQAWQRAETGLAEAVTLAREREESARAAKLLLLRAQVAQERGADGEVVAHAGAGATLAEEAGDDATAAASWSLLGYARIESSPDRARAALENALLAWGRVEGSVAQRAEVAYNLAVLDQEAGPTTLRRRLEVARALAEEAGSDELLEPVVQWLDELEEAQ